MHSRAMTQRNDAPPPACTVQRGRQHVLIWRVMPPSQSMGSRVTKPIGTYQSWWKQHVPIRSEKTCSKETMQKQHAKPYWQIFATKRSTKAGALWRTAETAQRERVTPRCSIQLCSSWLQSAAFSTLHDRDWLSPGPKFWTLGTRVCYPPILLCDVIADCFWVIAMGLL